MSLVDIIMKYSLQFGGKEMKQELLWFSGVTRLNQTTFTIFWSTTEYSECRALRQTQNYSYLQVFLTVIDKLMIVLLSHKLSHYNLNAFFGIIIACDQALFWGGPNNIIAA